MITVPKTALTEADDAGEAIAPEVGDTVDLGKAKARVASIDGDNYGLEILEINGATATYGKPAKAEHADMEDDSDDMEEDEPKDIESMRVILLKKAEKADKRAGL